MVESEACSSRLERQSQVFARLPNKIGDESDHSCLESNSFVELQNSIVSVPSIIPVYSSNSRHLNIQLDLETLGARTDAISQVTHCSPHKQLQQPRCHEVANPLFERPILVGYAFGPKKMKTMGIIMAEATKALTKLKIPDIVEKYSTHLIEDKGTPAPGNLISSASSTAAVSLSSSEPSLSSTVKPFNQTPLTAAALENNAAAYNDSHSVLSHFKGGNWMTNSWSTMSSSTLNSSFKSKKRSFDTGCCLSMDVSHTLSVSFVPIDLDHPLEEQHGGNFDVILHKLTEDILLCSSDSFQVPKIAVASKHDNIQRKDDWNDAIASTNKNTTNNAKSAKKLAQTRINRLGDYNETHPSCSLVDHPKNVQVLLSRAEISHTLSRCLVGVTTLSGISVRAPPFLVCYDNIKGQKETLTKSFNNETSSGSYLSSSDECCLIDRVDATRFTFPLIVKPLPAAGTVESHKMGIALNRFALNKVKTPCILQEYSNHDGKLFKVYVLGDDVFVFKRLSLPNLPVGERCIDVSGGSDSGGYVEFDSQKPYPSLADFGVENTILSKRNGLPVPHQDNDNNRKKRIIPIDSCSSSSPDHPLCNKMFRVTPDEIRPIATVIREAFGLSMFGFDVLVTRKKDQHKHGNLKEMLVVDVNYFPSYKEVHNFPFLLAQYLTKCALSSRTSGLQIK